MCWAPRRSHHTGTGLWSVSVHKSWLRDTTYRQTNLWHSLGHSLLHSLGHSLWHSLNRCQWSSCSLWEDSCDLFANVINLFFKRFVDYISLLWNSISDRLWDFPPALYVELSLNIRRLETGRTSSSSTTHAIFAKELSYFSFHWSTGGHKSATCYVVLHSTFFDKMVNSRIKDCIGEKILWENSSQV